MDLLAVLKALGDETRFSMYQELASSTAALTATELAERLGLHANTVRLHLERLREAGLSPELSYSAYHTLDSHIFGYTLWQLGHANATRATTDGETVEEFMDRILEQMRPRYPYLAEHGEQHMAPGAPDGKQEFEFGLDLILDGLKRRRRRQ